MVQIFTYSQLDMLSVELDHNPENPARSVMMGGVTRYKELNTHNCTCQKSKKRPVATTHCLR